MPGLYFEQCVSGEIYKHVVRRTVSESDNIFFTTMTMNVQPLHLDAEFASKTEFGRPLVNSFLTLALVTGLSVADTTLGTTLGNLGLREVNFPKPVFHGDTIRAETEIVGKRLSKSRPNAGIVEFEHRGYNQRDELVCICLRLGLMKRQGFP